VAGAALHNLLVGRVLVDRYRVEEVVWRGGIGVVFRAADLRLQGQPGTRRRPTLPRTPHPSSWTRSGPFP